MPDSTEVLAVLWQWADGTENAGARFWGCHAVSGDGRPAAWAKMGLVPIGAAKVIVKEGEGLDLLAAAADDDDA